MERYSELFTEKKWSGDVKSNYAPDEGLFKKGAKTIAMTLLKDADGNRGLAMKRLSFYVNRAGKNLKGADKEKLERAKDFLKAEEK